MKPIAFLLTAFLLINAPLAHSNESDGRGVAVLPSSPSDDEQLAWLVSELRVLEKAAREFESRQEQGAPAVKFRYNDLILDLNTILNGIESKLNRRDNPAYQFEVLKAEAVGY